jgi:hypothetical protein
MLNVTVERTLMLSKDEELRIEWMCEQLGTEDLLDVNDQKWLVSKLKEANDQLKNLHEKYSREEDMKNA